MKNSISPDQINQKNSVANTAAETANIDHTEGPQFVDLRPETVQIKKLKSNYFFLEKW